MLISYIIGLGTGIFVSFIVYMIIRHRNIKKKLDKISKISNYTNNISSEISDLLGFILNYIDEDNPSKLLKKEVKDVIEREADKWGARKDDTNNRWINIRSNISNSSDSPNRKGKPND